MADYCLSSTAEDQIDEILAWSEDNFGELTRERYAALLVAAMEDVADHSRQKAVVWKKVKSGTVGVYHVGDSRKRVPDPPGQIREARHSLIFRTGEDGVVDILGFIHDRMSFDSALRRIANASLRDE